MVAGAATAASARAQTCMTLRYDFQPDCYHAAGDPACLRSVDRLDLGPQIAVWVESADRTMFVDTLMVTNMTAARGIGNRPGVSNFLSGPLFPYGKRSMALPIWAHARGKLYDTVVMQDGRETWLGFHESLSSGEPYYCRPLRAQEINVDAITCPTRFTSAKGKLDSVDHELLPAAQRPDDVLERGLRHDRRGVSRVHGQRDAATRRSTISMRSRRRRRAYGAPYTGTWTIPTTLPAGDYALLVEVNKEFDNNAAHTHPSYADPQLSGYGLANNFGQPSVVYRVPIHIDVAAGRGRRRHRRPRSPDTATGRARTARSSRATRPSRPPIPDRARGACSRSTTAAGTGRVHVQVQPCGSTTACTPPPPAPGTVSEVAAAKDGLTDTSAVVTFKNAPGRRRRRRRRATRFATARATP